MDLFKAKAFTTEITEEFKKSKVFSVSSVVQAFDLDRSSTGV
jgi:hypothetical protein